MSNPRRRKITRKRPGPIGGKRDENRRARAQAISDAALSLFLERGLDNVTIDEIVQRARTAKGNFYRYYKDKADLVRALFAPMVAGAPAFFKRCEDALDESESEQDVSLAYATLAQDLGRFFVASPDLVRLYLQEARGPDTPERSPVLELARLLLDQGTRISVRARELGLLRDHAGRLTAIVVIGAVEQLLLRVFAGDDVGPLDALPAKLVSIILDGTRRAAPRRRRS